MSKQVYLFCSLALVFCLFIQISSAQTSIPFPQSVINHMATREMRYHHYLWHQVRDNWNKFSNTTKTAFRKIGWEPPRPARNFSASGVASAIIDNDSGEDFLYMHRQMIASANDIITKNKEPYGKITGWITLPAPGDKNYPVPKAYNVTGNPSLTSSTTNRKTDSYYKNYILPNEKLFKDPVQLKKMTLGELGARIENTIHNYLHMRFSDESPVGYRSSYTGTIPYIDKKWDNVTYNWLGDTYSSHVHPWFWKIHGWVDDRIEDWRKANNLTSIKWKGTWTGGPMSNLTSVLKKTTGLRGESSMSGMHSMDMSGDSVGNLMEEALSLVLNSGVEETTFGEDVILPPLETAPSKSRSCKKKVI